MTSYRLVNSFISSKFAVRNKHITSLLVCDRHFCSKDNETKTDKISSKDSGSKDHEENDNEESMKMDKSGIKAIISEDATKLAAKQKLMSLLSDIKIEAGTAAKKTSNLNLAKPLKRITKKERLQKIQEEIVTPEKEMDMAVKAVASSFKESEKVESELAEKLTTLKLSKKEEAVEEAEDINIEDSELNSEMNENLMSSSADVADMISESPIPPRSELAKRLMRLSIDQKLASQKKSMREVIEGMTIQSNEPAPPSQPVSQSVSQPISQPPQKIKEWKKERKFSPPKKIKKVDLFGSAPLNIFTPDTKSKTDSKNDFWQKLQERELKLMTQFAPANAFEEMIIWTEQGKHWKFPIDNEIDMGEEEKVGFHEHVFLDHHLKGFPTKGPIRHFMELVVVGLSKNPYITVDRKLENIEWFRNYFEEKKEILRDEGVLD